MLNFTLQQDFISVSTLKIFLINKNYFFNGTLLKLTKICQIKHYNQLERIYKSLYT